MADPELGDELELKANGTIRLVISGTHFTLRRPTAGEYFTLREALAELADAQQEAIKEKTEREAAEDADWRAEQEKKAKGKPKAEADAVLPRPRSAVAQVRWDRERQEEYLAWMGQALDTLCAKEHPDPPLWMCDPNLPYQLIAHWRSVPLASSGQ